MKNTVLILLLLLIIKVGFAQEKYVIVFLNYKVDKEALSKHAIDSLQEGHMANIRRLAREKKLLVAGPFEGGGGIFILNTTSVAEAKAWINSDPAIKADRYSIEILPWTPRVGSACLISEEVEFAEYTFIRYNSDITKFNVQEAPQWFSKHDRFMKEITKTGNVISEAIFDNHDGSTLIMKGEVEYELIYADPAVKNGILQPVIKTLWVGKGSFCEK